METSKLATGVAIVITAAWSASFVADMLVVRYDPPALITPLMLSVAGWLFGGETVKKFTRNGKTDSKVVDG